MRRAIPLTLLALLGALGLIAVPSRADDPVPTGPRPPGPPPAPAAPVVPPASVPSPDGGPSASAAFQASAARGYRHLTEKSYLPSTLTRAELDALWTVWPAPDRARAEAASPEERRRLTFERYGLTPPPGDPEGRPLQYVEDAAGRLSISCFACHAGAVAGQVVPGLPNASFAFQTLADDVGALRRTRGERSRESALSRLLPLGGTHGTTNAVMFSVALLAFRDADLNLVPPTRPVRFVHHDLDAPPWWNVRWKSHLYYDGFAPKGHRSLMQFLLVPTNGPERLRAWEDDFRDVLAYLESLTPPPWPYAVDRDLAAKGRVAFDATCARCHGTYGEAARWPEVTVPIDEIGTDRLRFDAILPEERAIFADSWFTGHAPAGVVVHTTGYVAPPLHGIWASAPYLHNGSVPTLWHVLHPGARPAAWRRRTPTGYDRVRVGLEVEERGAPPEGLSDAWERRAWFDTGARGKRAAGHRFPEALSEDDRRAVLEYLKTL